VKILVCIKILPDLTVNPFDASALEAALQVGGAEVVTLTMGRENTRPVLTALTRLGVKKAVLLTDPALAGADTLATSYALAAFVHREKPDLVMTGRQSLDGDTAQVGPQLAQLTGMGLITGVCDLTVEECVVARTREGEKRLPFPALLTVERSLILRGPSIFSKPGEVLTLSPADLGLDPEKIGKKGSRTAVVRVEERPHGKRDCTFVPPGEFVPLIKKLLADLPAAQSCRGEQCEPDSPPSCILPHALAVGEEAGTIARRYSETVDILPQASPEKMAELIASSGYPVIWCADRYGRETAPRVAAMLGLGLCADVVDIQKLPVGGPAFVRPAFGEAKLAWVKCASTPAMATMRPVKKKGGGVMALGRGCIGHVPQMLALAERLGLEPGASRGLVEAGEMPYPLQVGMTGRILAPRLYVAVGISGAVQHIPGMERAGKVIALNPDRNAPIFDYADYGIVADCEKVLPDRWNG